ncbi:MAG: CDC27 family protein [Planctomycetota bacterium]
MAQDFLASLRWTNLAAAALLVAAPNAWADDAYSEDSVLVATRKADEAEPARPISGGLEPISSHSEQEPELADPPEVQPPAVAKPAPVVTKATPKPQPLQPVTPEELQPQELEPMGASAAAPKPITPKPVAQEGERVARREVLAEQQDIEQQDIKQQEAIEQPAEEAQPSRKASASSRIVDPGDVAMAYSDGWRIDPARFHGIVPGESSQEDLVSAWGEPIETSPTEEGALLLYELPPFESVEVLIDDADMVSMIKVELDSQQQPDRLAKRLRLEKFRPVEILDEPGLLVVGKAYPEKGMVLLLAPSPEGVAGADETKEPPQFVTHMVIQQIDAEAFALRADQAGFGAFEQKLADLERAISIDPDNAYANWRLATLHRLTGASDKAAAAAKVCLDAEPTSDAYRLCWAECLAEQGKYDEAVIEARKVLDSEAAPAVVKAGSLHLMGRLASMGRSAIADKAIGFQNMAIDLADALATSYDRTERREAKRLLVGAHLAIAREISRRQYARKSEVVGQWIGRASGLAEEAIESGDANLEMRLIVARDALDALANLKPAKDPAPWVKEAEETAGELLADCRDKLYRSRVEWQLGQAYFHAMRVEHGRKQVASGLSYGQKAMDHLEAGAAVGEVRPAAESLVGRLYFHIGALYAVHRQDHEKAAEWYNRAEPLLTSAGPSTELVVPRRRGEALVSMGVSYWDQGQRDRAVELTLDGAELMENAVAAGVLEEEALGVPYGNLATMHRRLGDREESAKFAQLARDARGAQDPSVPSTFAEGVTKAAQSKTAQVRAAQTKPATESKPRTTQRTATQPKQTPSAKPKSQPQPTRTASRSNSESDTQIRSAGPSPSRRRRAASGSVRRPTARRSWMN